MDFGEVLRRAWVIIWKHKILWIFGIFAGCSRGGGGGGGGNSGMRFNNNPQGGGGQFQQYATQFSDWIGNHLWVVALFIIVLLVIIVLGILLGTMGRIGLMKGTLKAEAGSEHMGFAELWDESRPFFWRIFLLSLLLGLAFLIVLLPFIALLIAFSAVTFGIGALCILPFLCLLIPAGIVAGLVIQQAELAIVVENLSITDGLRRGWDVFRQNLGPVIVMWLILAVIAFVVGLVIAIPILIVVIPAAIAFAAANAEAVHLSYTPLIVAGVCFAAYLPVLLVLNGILTAYLQTAWTLTYLRLTRPKDKPVIESQVLPAPNA